MTSATRGGRRCSRTLTKRPPRASRVRHGNTCARSLTVDELRFVPSRCREVNDVKRIARLIVLFLAAWIIGGVPAARAAAPDHGKRVVGYFAGWSVDRFSATKIRGELLTHVNYAFAVIDKNSECAARDPKHAVKGFAQLRELKEKHPHLKTLISVGGWTDSGGFYDTARTPETRETFARSAAAFAKRHGFDGVDIDWEYPGGGGHDKGKGGPEDTKNFTALLAELRKHLDAQGV